MSLPPRNACASPPSLPGSGKNARLSLLSLPLLSSSIAGRSQDAVRYMPTLSLAKRVRMSELFWVSRDLPDRPSVTSDVYCSKPVLKPGSVSLPTHLSPSLTAYSPPAVQAREPSRWLASEPPLKANPSTSEPFSACTFLAAATSSSQVFGTSIFSSSNQSLRYSTARVPPPQGTAYVSPSMVSMPIRFLGISAWSPALTMSVTGASASWLTQSGTWSLPISVTSGPAPPAAAAVNLSFTWGHGIHSTFTVAPVSCWNAATSSSVYFCASGLLSPRRQSVSSLPAKAGPPLSALPAALGSAAGVSLPPQAARPRARAAVV